MKMKHDHLFRSNAKASLALAGPNVQTLRAAENLMRLRWDSGHLKYKYKYKYKYRYKYKY